MRKFVVVVVSAAASVAFFAAPSPAAASCSTVIAELGCIENVICGAAGTVVEKVPGKPLDDLHCIE